MEGQAALRAAVTRGACARAGRYTVCLTPWRDQSSCCPFAVGCIVQTNSGLNRLPARVDQSHDSVPRRKTGGVRSPHPRIPPQHTHARPSCTGCAECMTTTRPFCHAKSQERNTTARTHGEAASGAQIDPCLVSALISQPRTHPLGGGNAARVWAGIRRPYAGFCRILSSGKSNPAQFN